MPSKTTPKKENLSRDQQRTVNREKAREQARLLKEQEDARARRTRIGVIAGVVVAVVAVVALIVVLVKNASNDAALMKSDDGLFHDTKVISMQAPANVTEYGGISLGKDLVAGTSNEGAPQVDVYFDYSCHHCNDLGNAYGAQLADAAKAGAITLVYHPVTIMGTVFSYTGAAAEFFLAEHAPDKYLEFHDLLHEKVMDPYMKKLAEKKDDEQIEVPLAKEILVVAQEIGLSEDTYKKLSDELTTLEDTLLNGSIDDANALPSFTWINDTTNQFVADGEKASGSIGTPSVYLDGKKIEDWNNGIPQFLNSK